MAKHIIMPQVGQDVETAVLREWLVKEGDEVKKGDVVAIIDSDKAAFEVEAFESGTILKLLYEENDDVKVLEPIAVIGEYGENIDNLSLVEKNKSVEEKINIETEDNNTALNESKGESRIIASPSAKKAAKMHNIDLSTIKGSGPNGRIVKEDVLKLVDHKDGEEVGKVTSKAEYPQIRKKIAERMALSKQTIPHFYLFTDIDITDTLNKRKVFNESSELKISVNDLIVKSAAEALKQFPKLNCHVSGNEISILENINIGIAVSIEGGLLVPVIARADQKELKEISKLSAKYAADAKKGVISETAPASFTISNLGMYEITQFIPIINPPECAILGIGKAVKKVVPVGENNYGVWDTYGVRDILTVSLACDHRAVDGVYGAEFLESFKQNLENINI
jgi:pyruvate dehydrogenase E2 component (dihydrolipoamide acetyltransferase)